ncbi:MAG: hypothetical protein ICV63_10715 [Coleofasciculus sp. Co-bin14]|nr:hypothetical protein [Coleofasciculus sp. Co-bin14]
MFTQFRVRYPKGSLLTELLAIDHGKYIVRCLVQDEGTTLVSSLAAAETVELAEDQARSRALAILGISAATTTGEQETPVAPREVSVPLISTPNPPTAFSDAPSVATATATLSESVVHSQPTLVPEVVKASNATESVVHSQLTPVPDLVGANDTSFLSFSEPKHEEREKVADFVATTSMVAEELPFTDDEFSPADVETEISQEIEPALWTAETQSSSQLNKEPASSSSSKKKQKDTSKTPIPANDKPIDFSEVIARTNVELKRLGWTNQQGRDYLVQTYGKRSRQLLTDGELLDFLSYLETEPTPE